MSLFYIPSQNKTLKNCQNTDKTKIKKIIIKISADMCKILDTTPTHRALADSISYSY